MIKEKDPACRWFSDHVGLAFRHNGNADKPTVREAVPQTWKGSTMAKYTIESEHCSTFGMDVHARTTTVKGLDRSTGETKTKRFDNTPSPAEIASWMQAEFAGPWRAAYE